MNNTFEFPVVTANEEQRLQALSRYQVLDTDPEETFDNLVLTTTQIFNCPIAVISLVDKDRVFYKAKVGLGDRQIARRISPSSVTVQNTKPVVLRQKLDEILPAEKTVGEICFYAGAPLTTKDGYCIGSLCIMDKQDRDFDDNALKVLHGLAAIVMDELELRLSCIKETERYELAAKATHDAIWEWNVQGNKIWWNDGFRDVFGYDDSYRNRGIDFWYENFFDGDSIIVKELVNKTFAEKKETWQGEFRFKNTAGNFIHVLTRAYVLYDDHGEPDRMIVSMMDISERVEADMIKKNADENLLKEKDEFISIASHELKTPVTTIKGYAQILTKQLQDAKNANPAYLQFAGIIHQQADKLAELIKHLLDVSRIHEGKLKLEKESFNIGYLVEETVHEMKAYFPTHLIEITHIKYCIVEADRFRIKQVLTNLMSNAVKYSPGEERIQVSLEHQEDSGFVTIRIRDFGKGIPAKDIDQLFERFSALTNLKSNKIEGIGLGLYISMQIMQQHNSTIKVISDPGKGSEFSFILPCIK